MTREWTKHWECVFDDGGSDTFRMKIPGGWLYRERSWNLNESGGLQAMAVVYVPTHSNKRNKE